MLKEIQAGLDSCSSDAERMALLEQGSAGLVLFFGEGWHRPFNRRTVAAGRALAHALLGGGRDPRIVSMEEANSGDGPTFRYGSRWRVAFATPPRGVPEKVGNGMPTDGLFGRGDQRSSVRMDGDEMVVFAEQ